ncbi:MAG: N-acetyl-alpha-D-glucosaminyl L-malate synthase BshA [Verrucomicrobiota bacterium]
MNRPLRIGVVCYPSIGGSGILATSLGRLCAEAGHDVHFISYEKPIRLNEPHPRIFFHLVSVSEYSLFKYSDYTLPLSVKIADISEEYDLDVLHVHYAVPHATAALLARQMRPETMRPAVVTTLHGTDTTLLGKDPHYMPIIKHSMEHSDGVTTVSKSLKAQTIETFDVKHPIEVIYNFYDPAPVKRGKREVRQELGIADTDVMLLHMSNLRPVKRFGDILKAFSRLRKSEAVKLVVLAGAEPDTYFRKVRDLGIEDRVIFRRNIVEIDDYLNACDLGIYASEQESFGLSILETMCYGHPVVATNAGGIPEVIVDGETGLLVDVGDIEAMAQSIQTLVDDAILRQDMGRNGAERAAAYFSGSPIRDQYLKLYYKMCEQYV